MRRTAASLALSLLASGTVHNQAPAAASHVRALATALDRYIAAPDPDFRFRAVRTLAAGGATATVLDITSQQWLTSREVRQPIWRHWVTVIRRP